MALWRGGVLGIAVMVALGAAAAAVPERPPTRVVTEEESRQALAEALRFAEVRYVAGGEEVRGVAYLLGGRTDLKTYLAEVGAGKVPGVDVGVDASGLVLSAYRAVIPGLRFVVLRDDEAVVVSNVASETLYRWNTVPVAEENLIPGDLLFFRGGSGGVGGVALFLERTAQSIRFVSASASRGRVVVTGMQIGGDYYQERFVGGGRLTVVDEGQGA